MILKALCDYYDLHKDELPSYGLELVEIQFLIVIDYDGRFVRIEDRREDDTHSQKFLVRKKVKRASNVIANYLYDNISYAIGISNEGEDTNHKFSAFQKVIQDAYEKLPENPALKALHAFYQNGRDGIVTAIEKDPLWTLIKSIQNKTINFSFLLEGEMEIIAANPEIIALAEASSGNVVKRCLVTGKRSPIIRLCAATMIKDSQATASLVAFQKGYGFDSYGKKQCYNAPISKDAEFRFTTALLHLLGKDSQNKFVLGNRTFVFWASSSGNVGREVEDGIFSLFGFGANENNSFASIEQVRKVFKSIYTGKLRTSLDERFYILGLSPNAARIAVSYWAEIPLKEFAATIVKHFDDMAIVGTHAEKKPYYGLYSLLSATTATDKASPNLAEQLVKSIFQGLPYPFALYVGTLNRARAGQNAVSITQAAIFKAYLNRLPNNNDIILKKMLDKKNTNVGYLCGRLFAVLDCIQYLANGNSSIRSGYMNSASSAPAAVFGTILALSNHHMEKIVKRKKFEELKREIMDKISADGFPAHLDLQDQGRFFVGYYHQCQDIFTSNAETDEVTENDQD